MRSVTRQLNCSDQKDLHPVEVLHIHQPTCTSLFRLHRPNQLTTRLQDRFDCFVEVVNRESQVDAPNIGRCGLDVLAVGTNVLKKPIVEPEASRSVRLQVIRTGKKWRGRYALDNMASRSLHLLDEQIAINAGYFFDCLARWFHFLADLAAHDVDCGSMWRVRNSRG